jgi:hypothetical protein
MGLLTRLTTQGSSLSQHDGQQPPVNVLATQQSRLHADPSGQPGYSINGSYTPLVTTQYNDYEDGVVNPPPPPSTLDLDGVVPPFQTSPLIPGQVSLQALPYVNNQPQ